jgi:hypothetical protein
LVQPCLLLPILQVFEKNSFDWLDKSLLWLSIIFTAYTFTHDSSAAGIPGSAVISKIAVLALDTGEHIELRDTLYRGWSRYRKGNRWQTTERT